MEMSSSATAPIDIETNYAVIEGARIVKIKLDLRYHGGQEYNMYVPFL
jgi:hypothetical protein